MGSVIVYGDSTSCNNATMIPLAKLKVVNGVLSKEEEKGCTGTIPDQRAAHRSFDAPH